MQFQRPVMRFKPTASPTGVLPAPALFRPRSPFSRHPLRLSGLGGMGGLGDTSNGSSALSSFKSLLVQHIASKAGQTASDAATGTPSVGACVNYCATIFQQGRAGTLLADQQAAWNQWTAVAQDTTSDYNVYWLFGQLISDAQSDLVAASNAYEGSLWSDDAASAADYSLMDSTATGTTWYGGTAVTSLLDNGQWGTVFTKAFTCMQKAVAYGVLPLTYLGIVCNGMLQAPSDRRFPLFNPPGASSPTAPKGVAFRAALKQLGWTSVINTWFGYTNQGWVLNNSALESQDRSLSSAITALDYTSGEVILQQIQSKVQEYADARGQVVQMLQGYQTLITGPAGAQVSAADRQAMAAIQSQFVAIDQSAYSTLSTIGMWPGGTAGGLNGLGLVQLIIAGVIAITTLGIIAYVVTQMVATSKSAAAQTSAISKNILNTVDAIKASCQSVYDASAKTPADNAAYQACLLQTQKMYATIPPPPSGSDPLGLKSIAMIAAVGVAGLIALMLLKKRMQ